jgi:hypothetical protein
MRGSFSAVVAVVGSSDRRGSAALCGFDERVEWG